MSELCDEQANDLAPIMNSTIIGATRLSEHTKPWHLAFESQGALLALPPPAAPHIGHRKIRQMESLRRLADEPGTPAEGVAARAAMERILKGRNHGQG